MSQIRIKTDAPAASLQTIAKDTLLTAIVALVLAVPFIGLKSDSVGIALELQTRWPEMFAIVGAVVAGRVLFTLLRLRRMQPRTPQPQKRAGAKELAAAWGGKHIVLIGIAGFAFAALLPLMPFSSRYTVDIATTFLIYVMLGWGLNIVVGLAGLLDLGYVAFYAVGAYSYALLSTEFGWSFWVCLPLAGLFAASFGVMLGFPVLRLRGDYLAIVTLGFGEIIRVVLTNWVEFSKGPNGISGIPRPSFFGYSFSRGGEQTFHELFGIDYSSQHRVIFLYFLILALAGLTNWFTLRMRKLPTGRAWEALREDEIACRSLGINPTNVKLSAFALGAMFAGFAGSFFSTRQGFVSPESFTFMESAIILAIVVLGGMGSQMGVVLAAFALVILPEWFRDFQQYRMFLFGAAMVLIMVLKPTGVMGSREPTIRLHKKGEEPSAAAEAGETAQ
ncbi:leucine/isoleucine/valine transporter subunit; membrane component of ABC superfamily [uncultured Alphaproteobacteria bacterium]|uniref:Leucine/isoleucine/valine transporter subunit membrane component of ABC superfamily n=1 Tax=uncultured Alphaproteobacteria bacterium TaxID=91750 RepID=A0A212J313_9PROT|nr:leucine/isoleucine/valine transporter subunit; membrane component of ABC superfamily [uncultured Alphaproteobacteria bacterium]